MAGNDPIGKFSGTVIDKELKEPLPYATIIVNDMKGILVSGNISKEDGSFFVDQIEQGDYIFKVQFMGYKTYIQKVRISENNSSVNFGVIALEPELFQFERGRLHSDA